LRLIAVIFTYGDLDIVVASESNHRSALERAIKRTTHKKEGAIVSTAIFFKRCMFSLASSVVFLLALPPLSANATSLGCQVNQTDGVSLKTGQTLIENTTTKAIPKGTAIDLSVQVAPGVGKVQFVKTRVSTFGTLQKHDKMSGGDTPKNAKSCTASIALGQASQTISDRPAPRYSPPK